jgi:eukaryotic-like serine/threonine-protein kinase
MIESYRSRVMGARFRGGIGPAGQAVVSYETDSHIGQYRIVRKIGAGGMGSVYECEHVLLGRRAAIKTLLPLLSVQEEVVDRFFNEARATSAIADPGVVQVFDFGYHVDGTAYIVMELLEGESLADRLDRVGRLAPDVALRMARQLASALAAAHAQGIVHRDLKPENVFLIRDAEAHDGERAKLLDFGVCKLAHEGRATQSGVMLGTPVYMAPEQCRGAGGVDHRSDIYGLGCVLFHMLTGRVPFDGEGTGELIVAHLQHEPPAPSALLPTLPAAADRLIERCLAKDPRDRFQDMGELLAAIAELLPMVEQAPVATGDAATAAAVKAAATPLQVGFRSRFDANALPATARLRLGIGGGKVPTTLHTASGQSVWPPPSRGGARTVVAVIAAAAVAAVAITGLWLARGVEADAAPVSAAAPPMAAVEPAPAAVEPTVEPTHLTVEAIPEPPPDVRVSDVHRVETPAAKVKRPAKPTPRAPIRRPRVVATPPSVQAPAPAVPAPAPAQPRAKGEDLYDMR